MSEDKRQEDKIKKFYDYALATKKVDEAALGDYNTFSTLVSDTNNRVKMFHNLTKVGFNEGEIGNEQQFHDYFNSVYSPKPQQTAPKQPGINPSPEAAQQIESMASKDGMIKTGTGFDDKKYTIREGDLDQENKPVSDTFLVEAEDGTRSIMPANLFKSYEQTSAEQAKLTTAELEEAQKADAAKPKKIGLVDVILGKDTIQLPVLQDNIGRIFEPTFPTAKEAEEILTALNNQYTDDFEIIESKGQGDVLTPKQFQIRINDAKQQAAPVQDEVTEPAEEPSFGGEMKARLFKGLNMFNSALARTPEFLYDLAAYPQNALAEATGWNIGASSDKVSNSIGIDNKLAEHYEKLTKNNEAKVKANNEKYQMGIVEAMQQGDWETAGRNLLGGITESLPSSIAIMASGGTLGTAATLSSSALLFGSQKMQEINDSGVKLSDGDKTLISFGSGLTEGIFETFLGSGAMGGAISEIVGRLGKDAAEKEIKKGVSNLFVKMLIKNPKLAMFGEGFEEVGTQYTQNAIDKYSGYKPDIKLTDGLGDAFIMGVGMGAGFSAVGTGMNKYVDKTNEAEILSPLSKKQQTGLKKLLILEGNEIESIDEELFNWMAENKLSPEQQASAYRYVGFDAYKRGNVVPYAVTKDRQPLRKALRENVIEQNQLMEQAVMIADSEINPTEKVNKIVEIETRLNELNQVNDKLINEIQDVYSSYESKTSSPRSILFDSENKRRSNYYTKKNQPENQSVPSETEQTTDKVSEQTTEETPKQSGTPANFTKIEVIKEIENGTVLARVYDEQGNTTLIPMPKEQAALAQVMIDLPEGYRITQKEGIIYLVDPEGVSNTFRDAAGVQGYMAENPDVFKPKTEDNDLSKESNIETSEEVVSEGQVSPASEQQPAQPIVEDPNGGVSELEAPVKEPWEMTKKEYRDSGNELPEAYHFNGIVNAMREGKTIPEEVLADYPELKNLSPKVEEKVDGYLASQTKKAIDYYEKGDFESLAAMFPYAGNNSAYAKPVEKAIGIKFPWEASTKQEQLDFAEILRKHKESNTSFVNNENNEVSESIPPGERGTQDESDKPEGSGGSGSQDGGDRTDSRGESGERGPGRAVESTQEKQLPAPEDKQKVINLDRKKRTGLSGKRLEASKLDVTGDPYDITMMYFIRGGKINKRALEDVWNKFDAKAIASEGGARFSYRDYKNGLSTSQIAEKLAGEWEHLEPDDYHWRTHVANIIQKYDSPITMAKDIIAKYKGESQDETDRELANLKFADESELNEKQYAEGLAIDQKLEDLLDMLKSDENWPEGVELDYDKLTKEQLFELLQMPENISIFDVPVEDIIQKILKYERPENSKVRSSQDDSGTSEGGKGKVDESSRPKPPEDNSGKQGEAKLTAEQQRISDEYDQRISDLKDQLGKQRKTLQAELNKINKRADLFGEINKPTDGLVEQDFSNAPEHVQKALRPFNDKVYLTEKEIEGLEKEKVAAIKALANQISLDFGESGKVKPLAEAEKEVDPNPSEAQIEAGNYKKGHTQIQGLDITIENPKGSTRSGVDESGKEWSQKMNNTYGYFKRTVGKDGEQVDVFIGDNLESNNIFVIEQINKDGSFDEHKVMLGFNSLPEAKKAYLSNYAKGWTGLGKITYSPIEKFKEWLGNGTRKIKPYSEYKVVKQEPKTIAEAQTVEQLQELLGNDIVQKDKAYDLRMEELRKNPAVEVTNKNLFQEDVEKPTEKIEDFGEKIEGARKDAIKKYFDKINLNGKILSVIFPKPNFDQLLESGMSIKEVAGIKVAYEFAVQDKKRGEKVMKFYAAYAKSILAESINLEFKNENYVFTDFGKQQLTLRTEAYQKVSEKLGKEFLSLDLSKVRITKMDKEAVKFTLKKEIEGKYKVQYYVNTPKYFDTLDEAMGEFVDQVEKNTTKDTVEYKRKVGIYQTRGSTVYKLGYQQKGKDFITLVDDFKTAKEANVYRTENIADLQIALERIISEQKDASKKQITRLKYSNETTRERVGKDWRNGKDISSKEFSETFGLRGVEFGNWVNQKERQVFMNNSYDSLMDLAQLLNIPPAAISLSGELAVTFGSRGSGQAAAHYEPGRRIINLTKTKGLGSLAHEWFHAVDNYFAGFKVGAENMKSATRSEFKDNVRDNVKDSFESLYTTIRNSGLYNRSRALDSSKNKDYFSLTHEMAARSFENYILSRLNESGQINDFIVNYISNEDWNGDAGKYPYPIGEESKAINEAFQKLFDTIETKEENGNTVMFSTVPVTERPEDPDSAGEMLTDAYIQNYYDWEAGMRNEGNRIADAIGVKVNIVNSETYLPRGYRRAIKARNGEGRVKAFFDPDNGEIYVIIANNKTGDDMRYAILHEATGHKGLRLVFGEKFDKFLKDIYNQMTPEQIDYLVNVRRYDRNDHNEIAEEFLSMNFETAKENTWLGKIIAKIREMIRKVFGLAKFTQGDLNRLFGLSKEALRNQKQTEPQFAGEVLAVPRFMTNLWHGSPHSFDKFSTDNIGTGEGAQAFGHGLYFTDRESIARSYAANLSKRNIKKLYDSGEDMPTKAYNELKKLDFLGFNDEWEAANIFYSQSKAETIAGYDLSSEEYDAVNNAFIENTRNLYKVKIHGDKTIEELNFLRWDKELTAGQLQSIKSVYDYFSNIADYKEASVLSRKFDMGEFNGLTGEEIYNKLMLEVGGLRSKLESKYGNDVWGSSDKIASLILLDNGIDGIQYPAEYTTKGTHEDSFNYVVFDENAIEIDNHIRFSLVGEQGAKSLDKAEEATYRLDNLNVAREMESFTNTKEKIENAKAIKLATGWERGADGKWRYELPDGELIGSAKRDTDNGFHSSFENRLDKVLDSEVLKAYPELAKIKVEFKGGRGSGSFDFVNQKIVVSSRADDKFNVLMHEVQHAIQYIEGFATGGNVKMFYKGSGKDETKRAFDKYNRLAGEVESRNVSKRTSLTPEQRKESLIRETEDVSREDQIFIFNNAGSQQNISNFENETKYHDLEKSTLSPTALAESELYRHSERRGVSDTDGFEKWQEEQYPIYVEKIKELNKKHYQDKKYLSEEEVDDLTFTYLELKAAKYNDLSQDDIDMAYHTIVSRRFSDNSFSDDEKQEIKQNAIDAARNSFSEPKGKYGEDQTAPLKEKDFYKRFVAIHKDIQSKGKSKAEILSVGFKEGRNVNAMPFYKGYDNQTDMSTRFHPKEGDFVWLLPKDGFKDAANGYKTKEGYVPQDTDGFFITDENKTIYENYLSQFDETKDQTNSPEFAGEMLRDMRFSKNEDINISKQIDIPGVKHFVSNSLSTDSVYHKFIDEQGTQVVIRLSDHESSIFRAPSDLDLPLKTDISFIKEAAESILKTKQPIKQVYIGDEIAGIIITDVRYGAYGKMIHYKGGHKPISGSLFELINKVKVINRTVKQESDRVKYNELYGQLKEKGLYIKGIDIDYAERQITKIQDYINQTSEIEQKNDLIEGLSIQQNKIQAAKNAIKNKDSYPASINTNYISNKVAKDYDGSYKLYYLSKEQNGSSIFDKKDFYYTTYDLIPYLNFLVEKKVLNIPENNTDPTNPDIRFKFDEEGNWVDSPQTDGFVSDDLPTGEFAGDVLSAISAHMENKRDLNKHITRVLKEARQLIQDRDLLIREMLENAWKNGGIKTEGGQPYRDKNLSYGRMEEMFDDFKEKFIVPIGKITSKLRKYMDNNEIVAYMIAKHAPERNETIRTKKYDEWALLNQKATEEDHNDMLLELHLQDFSGVGDLINALFTDTQNALRKIRELELSPSQWKELLIEHGSSEVQLDKIQFDRYFLDPTKLVSKKQIQDWMKSLQKHFVKSSDQFANKIVLEAEARMPDELINNFWATLKPATDFAVDQWLAAEAITDSQHKEIKKMYKYFVPLRGWFSAAEKSLNYHSQTGGGPVIQKTEGRSSLADDPLAYIEQVAFKSIQERVSNEVNQALLEFVMTNPNNDLYELKEVYYVKSIVNGEEVWNMTNNRPTSEAFKSGDARRVMSRDHEKLRKKSQSKEHEVLVHLKGQDVVIVMKGEMLIVGQAMNNQNNLIRWMGSEINLESINKAAYNAIGKIVNIQKQLYTSLNIVFPFTNYSRDLGEALSTTLVSGSFNQAKDYLSYQPTAFKVIKTFIWNNKKFNPETNLNHKYYNEFRMDGGTTGYSHNQTIEQRSKELQGLIKRHFKGTRFNLLEAKKQIENVSRLFEDATRFSIYVSARKSGKGRKDAAMEAKEASVNFNRKGKLTKTFDAFYAFFNPAIQSLQKNAHLARIYPKRFASVTVGWVVLGFIITELNRLIGDDDEDKGYYNVNPYVRENYLVLPVLGDKSYLRIPLPQFWRGFYSWGVIMSDLIHGKKDANTAIINGSLNLLSGLTPIDVGGFWVDGQFSIGPLVPTVYKTQYEINENRNFLGGTIYREAFNEIQLDSKLHKSNVNPAMKMFTDALVAAFHPNPDGKYRTFKKEDRSIGEVPRIFDMNPSVMEHRFRSYGGGSFKAAADLFGTLYAGVRTDEEIVVDNVPIINAFIRRYPEKNYAKDEEYWNIKKKVDVNKMLRNETLNNPDPSKKLVDPNLFNDYEENRVEAIIKYSEREINAMQTELKAGAMEMDEFLEKSAVVRHNALEEIKKNQKKDK